MAAEQFRTCVGQTLVGSDGGKIGKIKDVYMNDETDEPEWLAVTTGVFGTRVSFVPIAQASFAGDDVVVPYDKGTVKDAPNAEADGELSAEDESALYGYYGLDRTGASTTDREQAAGTTGDDAMTRSEEELETGVERKPAGRARLRKWVETEHVTTTVPVRKEKAVIEREPITDENVDAAMEGPDISESEHEIVLHEEEPVVAKRTVPKERVRLSSETETDEREVSAELRKERIEADGDVRTRD